MGLLIIVVLYLLVNLSYYQVVGFDAMKTDREAAYTLVQKIAGSRAAQVFSFLLFFGVLSYINALLLSNPRVMFAMSTEGSLPKVFGQQNERGVLTVSLTVFTAICLVVLFFSQQFETLLSFSIFLDCFGFVFSTGALFLLRPKTRAKEAEGIFTMKRLYPWATVFFMLAYVFVGASIAMDDPATAGIGLLVLAGLIGLYLVVNKMRGQRSQH
jgi:APA family basic amino acid/polyamine antiporter